MQRVFITGMGVISPIGISVAANRLALENGRSGILRQMPFETRYASFPAGVVALPDAALSGELGVDDASATRTGLLALHAMREAVADAQLSGDELSSRSTALIVGTTVGGMTQADDLYRDVTGAGVSPFIGSYDCASVSFFLQKHHRIGGICNTINTACSSSANAIIYGTRLIRHGLARRAIVGGVDSLSRFTVNGFGALHILSPETCTPFDNERRGLNLGEGAAFLVIEGEEYLDPAKKIYGELTGYSNTTDAFHPTSLSPEGEGPVQAMLGALSISGLHAAEIDFINAHGTATENNDLVESRAMCRVFGQPPPFVSTKSYTGHTLGAAAAVEAVFSLLSLQNQVIYPSLYFSEPIVDTGLRPTTTLQRGQLRHVMSNSFGFGGNCASLIFSKS